MIGVIKDGGHDAKALRTHLLKGTDDIDARTVWQTEIHQRQTGWALSDGLQCCGPILGSTHHAIGEMAVYQTGQPDLHVDHIFDQQNITAIHLLFRCRDFFHRITMMARCRPATYPHKCGWCGLISVPVRQEACLC